MAAVHSALPIAVSSITIPWAPRNKHGRWVSCSVTREDSYQVRWLTLGVIAATAALMTGCTSRNIDVKATGASPVSGAANLYRFCDGPVLIYFTKVSGNDDQYDWYWPGGCGLSAKTGQWTFIDAGPAQPPPNGDSTGGN